ncbi:senescence-associated gene 21 [Euphorbia peplus]|nr:senescence-associated gene 21 [Euphorbia peplus]
MNKLQIRNFLLLSRRSYVAETENLCKKAVPSVMKDAANDIDSVDKEKKTSWMRDPATGYWIPETHFGQIDEADMRAKFQIKKN